MFKKILFLFAILVVFASYSQQATGIGHNWQIGVGGDIVRFGDKDVSFIGDKHVLQLPRFNVTKRLNDFISIDAAISFGAFDSVVFVTNSVPYFSFDVSGRYKYITRYEKLDPYVFIGASILDVRRDLGMSPTANAGTGITYWFVENVGINGQILYKNALNKDKLRSHIQLSVSVIFGFNSNRNGSARCHPGGF